MDTGLYCSSGQKGPFPFGPGMFLAWERGRDIRSLTVGTAQSGPLGQPAHLEYFQWGAGRTSNGRVGAKRVDDLFPDLENFSGFCQLIGSLLGLKGEYLAETQGQFVQVFQRCSKPTLWDSAGQVATFTPPLIMTWHSIIPVQLSLLRNGGVLSIVKKGQTVVACPYLSDRNRFEKLAELLALLANMQVRVVETGWERTGMEFFTVNTAGEQMELFK